MDRPYRRSFKLRLRAIVRDWRPWHSRQLRVMPGVMPLVMPQLIDALRLLFLLHGGRQSEAVSAHCAVAGWCLISCVCGRAPISSARVLCCKAIAASDPRLNCCKVWRLHDIIGGKYNSKIQSGTRVVAHIESSPTRRHGHSHLSGGSDGFSLEAGEPSAFCLCQRPLGLFPMKQ